MTGPEDLILDKAPAGRLWCSGPETPEKGATMFEITPAKVVQVILLAREENLGAAELHAFIAALSDDDKAQLTAVAWVGRGAFEAAEFDEAVQTAVAEATTPTEDYLMGMPHLAENLEAGLEALGVDVTGEEEDLL
jgi:hypothetical protein